jgi:molecular chaperone GrpE
MPIEDSRATADPDPVVTETPQATGLTATIDRDGSPVRDQQLVPLVERLAGELSGLRRDFDAKIRYDEVKQQQITAMHEELQTLRAGLHLRLLQPMFTDLIAMHDDLADVLSADDSGANAATHPAKILESLKESILETLLRNGVSSYSVDSDELDRSRQRVIDAVGTTDPTLDRRVIRRPRVGFEYDGGKVLRPEWVVVHRYTGPQEPA